MGPTSTIITAVAVAVLVPLILGLFYRARVKEERKHKNGDGDAVTRMAKWQIITLNVLIPIIAVLCLVVAIGAALDREYGISVAMIVTGVVWSGTFYTLYFWVKLRYEIATDEKIILVRKFGKKRTEYYFGKDVFYYSYMPGYMGSLVLYDKYCVPLVQISQLRVGISAVLAKVQAAKVQNVALPFPPPFARNTAHYKRHKTATNAKIQVFLCILGGLFLLIGALAMFFSNEPVPEYSNHEVTGRLEKVKYNYDTVEIKLYGDESEYYVNSIVYNELDVRQLRSWIPPGSNAVPEGEFKLWVAYEDGGKKNLSHISFNGIAVLNADSAELAELENYKMCRVVNIGMWVVAGILIIAGVVLLIVYLNKLKVKPPCDEPAPKIVPPVYVNPFIRIVKVDPFTGPIDPFDESQPGSVDPFDMFPPPKENKPEDPFGDEYSAPSDNEEEK